MSSIDFEFEKFIDFSFFADDINSNSMNEIYNQNYIDPLIPNYLGFASPKELATPNSTSVSSGVFHNKFYSTNIKRKDENAYKIHKPHTQSKQAKHTSRFDMFELAFVLNNELFFDSGICPEKLIETNKDCFTSGNIFEEPGKQGKENVDLYSEEEKNKNSTIDNNLQEGEQNLTTTLLAAVNLSETNTRATSQTLVPSPPLSSNVSPLNEFSKSGITQNTAPSISEILDDINLDNIDVLFFNEDPINVTTEEPMIENFSIDDAFVFENGMTYGVNSTEELIGADAIYAISIENDDATRREIKDITLDNVDTTLFDEIDDTWSSKIDDLTLQNFKNDSIIHPKKIIDVTNNSTFCISSGRNIFKKSKRDKPQFVVSGRLLARADKYWNYVSQHQVYSNLLSKSINALQQFDIHPLDAKFYKNSALAAILPNYAKIDFFKSLQGIDGWVYEINKKCKFPKPALRWCGQKLNFYEPYIVRYKINNGKQHSKEALCPYCPVTEQMDLSNIFHTIQDSSYMHHVCKDHGVYSTGYEMLPPLIGTQNNKPVAYCAECGEICKLILSENPEDLTNSLISYFRHAFNKHNRKKQNRTQRQKEIDEAYFNSGSQNFVYE